MTWRIAVQRTGRGLGRTVVSHFHGWVVIVLVFVLGIWCGHGLVPGAARALGRHEMRGETFVWVPSL